MPTVSVITPCYNAELTIAQSIESVLSQTYSDWEMIIVDDCSKDNSVSVIKSFLKKDDRIKLIQLPTSSGSPTKPRNTSIENASGRYIAFLDSDDIWHPTKLERQLKLAEQSNSPLIFSNYEKMNTKGELSNRAIIASSQVTLKDMYYGNQIGCLTVMIDTLIIPNFRFKNIGHEDCVAWIEILQKGYTALNTNSIEAAYRESTNSVSSNKMKILHWQWNIYRKVLKFNPLKSAYYYMHYAVRGFLKSKR